MDEHVLQNDPDFQSFSSTSAGIFGYVPMLGENTLCHQHIAKAEDCYSCPFPQWIGYQQVAPYCVEYLAGSGASNIQGEIPYGTTGIERSFKPEESCLTMDSHQKQGPDEGLDNAGQKQPNMSASSSGIKTKSRRTYSRQKACDADRRRRTRIAAALDALEDLLPQSKEGNTGSIVDDCIDYIKHLQLHMKELSQNRLGGEPTSYHLTHLEGYGHYLLHENQASGPLQDMLAKLLEVNPSAATKLLESRGIFMMPIAPN